MLETETVPRGGALGGKCWSAARFFLAVGFCAGQFLCLLFLKKKPAPHFWQLRVSEARCPPPPYPSIRIPIPLRHTSCSLHRIQACVGLAQAVSGRSPLLLRQSWNDHEPEPKFDPTSELPRKRRHRGAFPLLQATPPHATRSLSVSLKLTCVDLGKLCTGLAFQVARAAASPQHFWQAGNSNKRLPTVTP